MAVKASATITLSFMVDIKAYYRFYKLQSSTATAPTAPTTNPSSVPSGWTDSEPTYTSGSTNSLYFVDATLFANNTFSYSAVSKSTAYEAAKEAYNKAVAAQNTANNAQSDIDNLEIGGRNLFYATWASHAAANTDGEFQLDDYQSTGSFTQFYSSLTFDPSETVGETYTVSFWAKSPNGSTPLSVYNQNGNPRYFYLNTTTLDTALSTEWKYYAHTFTNVDKGEDYDDTDSVCRRIEIYASGQMGVLVKKIKIEKGNRPSDWTPAPESTQSQIDNINSSIEVIVGTQTAATGSWTGLASFASLKDGQQITYWLPYAGSGNATLNLTLSGGDTTGAKNCYYGGTSRLTTHYPAGSVIRLMYRENVTIGSSTYTGWWADANYDSNYYDRVRLNNSITAKSAISASRFIVSDSSGFFHLAASTAFDITKPILWAYSSISASSTGNNNYLSYSSCTLRNNKSGITLTKGKTCYIVGTLENNTFTPNSTLFTSTEPTEEDGLTYISLGYLYSTYQIYLYPEHPIYQYVNGGFKSTSQIAYEAKVSSDNAQDTANNAQDTADTAVERVTSAQSTIDSIQGQIKNLITGPDGSSLMVYDSTSATYSFSTASIQNSVNTLSQNINTLTNDLGSTTSSVEVLQQVTKDFGDKLEYVRITTYEDEPCIELGESDSDFKLLITNTRIMFRVGSGVPTYISNTGLITENIEVKGEFKHGRFMWSVRQNGNYGLVWI